MDRPTAFLFDIGNVLLRFDFGIAERRLTERSRRGATDFRPIDALKSDLESGRIDDDTFVRTAMDELAFEGTPAEFATIWQEIFLANDPMVALVEALAPRFPLYLLSNTSGLHLEYILREFPFFGRFRGGVYSHVAGTEKPDEAIYHQAIDAFQLDPARTIYIDDLPANAEAGRRIGFLTHRYSPDDHDALLGFLADHGVNPDAPA